MMVGCLVVQLLTAFLKEKNPLLTLKEKTEMHMIRGCVMHTENVKKPNVKSKRKA